MMNIDETCCFTGHKPVDINGYDIQDNMEIIISMKNIILDHIENKGVSTFVSGMTQGVVMWGTKLILALKHEYPHIKLVCALPCINQTKNWNNLTLLEEYESILKQADEVVYVSNEDYTDNCMRERNQWMVDNSEYVIAVWKGSIGGTSMTVKYAVEQDKHITRLHPFTMKVSKLDW